MAEEEKIEKEKEKEPESGEDLPQEENSEEKKETSEEQTSEEEKSPAEGENDLLNDLLEGESSEEPEDPLAALETEESTPEEKKDSSEEDPLADLLSEEGPPEELLQTEEETEEEEEEEEDSEESPKKGLLLTLASVICVLLFLGAGVGALWYFWTHPPLPQVSPSPPKISKEKTEEKGLAAPPISVQDRQILFLKNFLLPYQRETGEYVFVKAKVLLYFTNQRDFHWAKKNETLFREHIYRILKNVPLYVWEHQKGREVVRKELLTYLKKEEIGGVAPEDLEVTGYILK